MKIYIVNKAWFLTLVLRLLFLLDIMGRDYITGP